MKTTAKLLLRASLIAVVVVAVSVLPGTGRRVAIAGPCDFGAPDFNLSVCTQAFGVPTYCQVGSTAYNPALCAQTNASTSATGCAPGTAAAICLLTGQTGSVYC